LFFLIREPLEITAGGRSRRDKEGRRCNSEKDHPFPIFSSSNVLAKNRIEAEQYLIEKARPI
jgi:hypothetical protein